MLRTLILSALIVPQLVFAAPMARTAIDTKTSTVTWKGSKEFVDGAHTGTVAIKSGFLTLNPQGQVSGGEFTIDMTSIKNTDLTDEGMKTKLVGHLMAPDFFDVANHKEAKFVITKVTAAQNGTDYVFDGNLTIRGKTNSVTIPTSVKKEGNAMVAAGKFEFDRTKFDVKYNSKNFVPDLVKTAKDKVIKNTIALEFTVKTQM